MVGTEMPAGRTLRDDSCRHSNDSCIVGHICRYDGTRPDNRPFADLAAREDDGTAADERSRADIGRAADICTRSNSSKAFDSCIVPDGRVHVQLHVGSQSDIDGRYGTGAHNTSDPD